MDTHELYEAATLLDDDGHADAARVVREVAEKLTRAEKIEKAAREYEQVTTYARDEEDSEVCAYCQTNLGQPHKKDCRASLAHKTLLKSLTEDKYHGNA